MSNSFTSTQANTFTATHAKHISAKVATDLKRMQRMYNEPSDLRISQFEAELVELLKAGYLDNVKYGFMKDDKWIVPTLSYTAKELSESGAVDDDPGRVPPGADVSGASFYSYLKHNQAWFNLTNSQRDAFESALPLARTGAAAPEANGYFSNDKSYSAGTGSVDRSSLKNW